jgi:hypothetical protein
MEHLEHPGRNQVLCSEWWSAGHAAAKYEQVAPYSGPSVEKRREGEGVGGRYLFSMVMAACLSGNPKKKNTAAHRGAERISGHAHQALDDLGSTAEFGFGFGYSYPRRDEEERRAGEVTAMQHPLDPHVDSVLLVACTTQWIRQAVAVARDSGSKGLR